MADSVFKCVLIFVAEELNNIIYWWFRVVIFLVKFNFALFLFRVVIVLVKFNFALFLFRVVIVSG